MSRLINKNNKLVEYIPQQTMTNQTDNIINETQQIIFNTQFTKDEENIFNDIKLKCYINKIKLSSIF